MKEVLVRTLKNLDNVSIVIRDNEQQPPTKFLISRIEDNRINIIDYEAYDTYGKEENKNSEFIIGDKLVINEIQFFNVIDVQDEYIEIVGSPDMIIPYVTTVFRQSYKSKNTLLIEGLHSFNKRENNNLYVKIERFDLILTVFDDYEGYIAEEIQNKIAILLSRDLYCKERKKIIYINSPLSFEVLHNNKDNKVLRGSISLKEYKN